MNAYPMRTTTALRWTMLALGVAGVAGGVLQLGAAALHATRTIANPVFGNARRLPYEETMLHHVSAYGVNVAMVALWIVVLMAAAYSFALLLHACYRAASAATLTAGVFLAGATIAGVQIGTSLLKVSEFALQAMAAAPAEQEWLTAGINWLTQLHLFYVTAWMIATGAGFLFLGAAARAAFPDRDGRRAAHALRAGGAILLASVSARAMLPLAGPGAPAFFVALGEPLATLGFGLGFGASGLLLGAVRSEAGVVPGRAAAPV